jgi:hypothetical protein
MALSSGFKPQGGFFNIFWEGRGMYPMRQANAVFHKICSAISYFKFENKFINFSSKKKPHRE